MNYERIFTHHGIRFLGISGDQKYADCPFCGKERKLYVNPINGGWDCKVCRKKGFTSHFLEAVSEDNSKDIDEKHWRIIEEDRGIDRETFKKFQLGFNGIRYTLPIKDASGVVVDLRTFKPGTKSMATPGCSVGLFGSDRLFKVDKRIPVYLCEGEWDAISMEMLLSRVKKPGVVLAVPGANVFKREWIPALEGRDVIALYDNDEAGENGERLAWERLTGTVKSLQFVHWPDDAPIGFDTRDWVRFGIRLGKPEKCYEALLRLCHSRPRKLQAEEKIVARAEDGGPPEGELLSPEETMATYRKWMHLDDDNVLKIIFGVWFANRLEGEPIWMFLVDPPGGGKSELLMSLSEHSSVYATTSLTPHTLISGATWSNGKDPSLLPQLDGKLMIIKDFTTIIAMHYTQSQEICGTLRDAYDGQTARNFGTGIRRSYKSKFGILAGVTDKIETFSTLNASLGERFLRFRMHLEDRETEEQKIMKALSNIGNRLEMRNALVRAANGTLNRPMPAEPPQVPHSMLRRIVKLAQFTSMLRGTVDRDHFRDTVQYRPTYEVGTRLAVQLSRIGMGIATFLEKEEVGAEEFFLMRKVALDTAPDRLTILIKKMWDNPRPLRTNEISFYTRLPQATVFRLLQDLELLRIVDRQSDGMKHLWYLSERIKKLVADGGIYEAPSKDVATPEFAPVPHATTPKSVAIQALKMRLVANKVRP